ncbi:MAG: hypothetical protein HY682_08945 [Chloroflexi bacterium]|nr:hypothetical protein [Chloroflexota bacterium]
MGHIGNIGHAEVQKVIDEAVGKINKAGRVAGHTSGIDSVASLTRRGFRFLLASSGEWLSKGAKQYLDAAQAGGR